MITARLALLAALLCAPVAAFASVWSPKATADVAPVLAAPDAIDAPATRADNSGGWVVMGDPTRPFFLPPDAFAVAFSSADNTSDKVPCGEGRPAVTPDNGVSGQAWGATKAQAEMASGSDCMKKLIAYSKVKCGQCEDLSTCRAWASVLFDLIRVETYQTSDGLWHSVTTYTGPYFVFCDECP